MGAIEDRMDGDLRLRGLSEVTRTEYLRCVAHFVAYYRVSPETLGARLLAVKVLSPALPRHLEVGDVPSPFAEVFLDQEFGFVFR